MADFSVQPLCLCGQSSSSYINHRDTENTEVAQRSVPRQARTLPNWGRLHNLFSLAMQHIHPKLRNDSTIFPTRDGVMFRNDYQNFFLQGEALYPVITALVPLCNGKRTLKEIISGFPDKTHETLTALVLTLIDRGVLKDQPPEADVPLSDAIRERFSAQIEFIDAVADRPVERFATFRRSRVLLAGSGLSYAKCAASLIRYGLESLSLLPVGEASIVESIEEARVSEFDVESSDFARLVDAADLVAYCSDRSSMSVLVRLNCECCVNAHFFGLLGLQSIPPVRRGDG